MPLVKWSPAYSVNIEEMDKQHQELLGVMNRLYEAIAAGYGSQEPSAAVDQLLKYAQEHFSAEERLMQRFRFPQLGGHKSEHRKFTEQASDLQRRLKAGQSVSAYEVLQFLRQWLVNHIQVTDAKYGKFINALQQRVSAKA
jgi:hemerythrin